MSIKTHAIFLTFCLSLSSLNTWAENLAGQTLNFGIYQGFLKRFPETNGIRWSDTVAHAIFSAEEMNIEVKEFPPKRLALALSKGDIDIFLSSRESLGKYADQFLQAKLPVSVVTWNIYYKDANGWEPSWPADAVFKQKIGKSQQSSESLKKTAGLKITQAGSFDAIVKMVNAGRADYWVDNRIGIRNVSPGLIKGKEEGFIYRPLFSRGLYFYFQNNDKGKALLSAFNLRFEQLLNDGLYLKTYYDNDTVSIDTNTADETLAFIRNEFPDFPIPEQQNP